MSIGEGNGTPLQYSCLENPMDRGAWWAAVHGVTKSQTWLSDFTFTFQFYTLEKEMATHSSVLAWRIPGTGSHRVRHDWSDLAAASAVISMCRVISCVAGRGCLLWPVCSLGKTLLTLSLLHSVLQDQICLFLQVFLDFLLFHPVPYNEKDIFWGC